MQNSDRINKWRKGRPLPSAASMAEAEDGPAEGGTPEGRAIPSRRSEEVEYESRLREEIADGALPTSDEIDAEIADDQQRRLTRRAMLRRRLIVFLGLPLLIIGLYKILLSPPVYQAQASFAIVTAAPQSAGIAAAGLLGGGGGSGLTDAYRIREYLLSREAMQQMERRYQFLTHFREATNDPLQRPHDLPLFGIDAHDFYKRRVSISVDMREGIVRLDVDGVTAEQAERFANGFLTLARERTRKISDHLNADQFRSLQNDVSVAQEELRLASARVAGIQRRRSELDPQQSAAGIYQMIGNLEVMLADAQAERMGLLANGLSESPLLPRLDAKISEVRRQIAAQRARLVGGAGATVQNAAVELELANGQRRLSETGLEAVLRTFEQAKLRSIEERRYLVVISAPVLPEKVQFQRFFYSLLLALIAALLLWGLLVTLRNSRALRSAA